MQSNQVNHCCSCGSELEDYSVFCPVCGKRNVIKISQEYPQPEDSRCLELDEDKTEQTNGEECLEDDFNTPYKIDQIDDQLNADVNLATNEDAVPWYDSSFWDVPVPFNYYHNKLGCLGMLFSLLSGNGYGECEWVRGRWGLILFWIPGALLVLLVVVGFISYLFLI